MTGNASLWEAGSVALDRAGYKWYIGFMYYILYGRNIINILITFFKLNAFFSFTFVENYSIIVL